MKRVLSAAAVAAVASVASADTVTVDYNVDSIDSGTVVSDTIALPDVVSIDSITIDIAHTWGGDLEITLTSPTGDVFELMFDDVDTSGSGNFDMGLVGGSGALDNVAPYEFVESGGLPEWDDSNGVAPAGTYNANAWASGGWSAGDWTLLINDDAGGDPTSIGSVTIAYTIPAPGALALLGLAGLAGRRRRA
ncbi:MAG: proprotein convertase P-domain-containing protein [Planctomycetota bacterium]